MSAVLTALAVGTVAIMAAHALHPRTSTHVSQNTPRDPCRHQSSELITQELPPIHLGALVAMLTPAVPP